MEESEQELRKQVVILKQAVDQSRLIHKKYDEALLLIRQKDKELKKTDEELRQMQDEIVQREKMASLGSLVAGVAHEVNTPLGVSITSASVILNDCKKIKKLLMQEDLSEEDLNEFLDSSIDTCELLLRNLDNAAKLVQSFKQVSVDQSSDIKRSFDVKLYLEEIGRTYKAQFKKKNIDFDIVSDEGVVMESYAGAFSQIFSNLLQNSINHAFEGMDGGKITIVVTQKPVSVEIEFKDNGIGFDESVKEHIFEPFVTTKRGQGGSGLGLNIVYNLVTNKFNGSIRAQSDTGAGATFFLTLAKA